MKTSCDEENILITLIKENIPQNSIILLAKYDKEGILREVYRMKEDVISIPKNDAEVIKALCLEDSESMKPICENAVKLME